ncbi:MAG: hypothetical protein WBM54_07645 [Woeseia sp.]
MPKKASSGSKNSTDALVEADANVDKIRDILFGGQMRDYEKRFASLEKRLSDSIERASRDMQKQVERLDHFTRREFEKLAEQLQAERKERTAEGKKSVTEFNEYADQVEGWFAEVEERLSEEAKDIRESLHEQHNDVAGQLQKVQGELQEEFSRETAELANQKVAREDLAALFTELAMRLNKDFKLPKA